MSLTHLDASGRARMVDVSDKPDTVRAATARGKIVMRSETLQLAVSGAGPKGAVEAVAEIAGVMAAKRTADLIPLCHPMALSGIDVVVEPVADGLQVTATVRTTGPTGVEMEALTAVSVTLLTIYDMLKAADKAMVIGGIALVEKQGGRSGTYRAEAS